LPPRNAIFRRPYPPARFVDSSNNYWRLIRARAARASSSSSFSPFLLESVRVSRAETRFSVESFPFAASWRYTKAAHSMRSIAAAILIRPARVGRDAELAGVDIFAFHVLKRISTSGDNGKQIPPMDGGSLSTS